MRDSATGSSGDVPTVLVRDSEERICSVSWSS